MRSFAFPASTEEFKPEIVPASLAMRNDAGFPGLISNAGVPLKTCPAGDGDEFPVAATLTTTGLPAGSGCPRPLYSVLVPERLFEIQKGLDALNAIPQGFTRFT